MKLIIRLGNPGEQYKNTRHNIGFEILDLIHKEWGFSEFSMNAKFKAEISQGLTPLSSRAQSATDEVDRVPPKALAVAQGSTPGKILLAKPQTFMNLSGEAVRSILDFYKLTFEDIIVIHDDLDIAVGKYKIATDSSSAGHNGVQDIIEKIGTQKFKRIRIGIGEATEEGAIKCRLGAHDFVLEKFTTSEIEKLQEITPTIITEIKTLITSN